MGGWIVDEGGGEEVGFLLGGGERDTGEEVVGTMGIQVVGEEVGGKADPGEATSTEAVGVTTRP